MKRTLYLKLLGGYLLFALLAIVLLSTFTEKLAQNHLLQVEAERLYRESAILASDYRSSFKSEGVDLPDMQKELEIIGGYMGSEIWIMDTSGRLLINSSDPNVQTLANAELAVRISDFNISYFGNHYYQVGNFYEKFRTDTLTVFSPITIDYKVRGYVLIHKPMTTVLSATDSIVNIVFASALGIFLCSFIFLFVFTFVIYRPINKITKVAKSYAKGDFKQKIKVKNHDEIGYVAQTMNYMATELDTLEDEQRKFISNISHDFRSPLTSIKGYIEAMIDGTIPVEMQEKYLNIILFETERLNKLTKSLLELNKFGSRGIMLDVSTFDINQTIKTTVQTFEGVCTKKQLSFDLTLTGDQLMVRADYGKIQQILYNLIDNAIKFSHDNSTIYIETTTKNEKVFISVKDTGIGIPKDSINKIWERFYKSDLSRGKDKKGTGLGLSIVKEIINAHNENINCISTEGVGTEFIFTLPLTEK